MCWQNEHILKGEVNTVWLILSNVSNVLIRIKYICIMKLLNELYNFSDSVYKLNVLISAFKMVIAQYKYEWGDLNTYIKILIKNK